jgi:hypothetical protein
MPQPCEKKQQFATNIAHIQRLWLFLARLGEPIPMTILTSLGITQDWKRGVNRG